MKRIFKKPLACLIAVLMIVSSLPFTAVTANAATVSLSRKYTGVLINSTSGRYAIDSSKVATLTVVNDMQASNSDVGYAGFDISSFSVGDNETVEASYSFNELIENSSNEREDCGLTVYYPTKNIDDFLKDSKNAFSSGIGLPTHSSSGDTTFTTSTTFISKVKDYYGLVELTSFDPIIESGQNTTVTQTVDIGPAIKSAKLLGQNIATICFMLSQAGGTAAAGSSSSTKFSNSTGTYWSDTKVILNNNPVSATTKTATADDFQKLINTGNASVTLPSETYVNTASSNTDFMKGVVYAAGWTSNGITQLTSSNNSALYFQFGVNGLSNAVAVYTGSNDIRFPVIAYNRGNGRSNNTYIRSISLAANGFELGNNWYRCNGEQDLTLVSNDPQNFSKDYDGTHLTSNNFLTSDSKQWRNYIKYIGTGNTTNYYEKLPTQFKFRAQYGCNSSSNGGYDETKSLEFSHGMYVLNMKPYKDIVDSLNTDYSNVENESWLYTDSSLTAYYKAVLNIINFNITSYVSSITGESSVQTAANAIKTVVNNYNSAKSGLTKKSIKITFHRLNGSDETRTITAGDSVGSIPANSPAKHIDNTQTHNTYAWESSASSTTVPHSDVTYN